MGSWVFVTSCLFFLEASRRCKSRSVRRLRSSSEIDIIFCSLLFVSSLKVTRRGKPRWLTTSISKTTPGCRSFLRSIFTRLSRHKTNLSSGVRELFPASSQAGLEPATYVILLTLLCPLSYWESTSVSVARRCNSPLTEDTRCHRFIDGGNYS